MFMHTVNAACINAPFIVSTIAAMEKAVHESLQRLLDAARDATAHLPLSQRIEDANQLRKALDASPQSLNNWKTRGLSKDVAVDAEARFGCSAAWLLSGKVPPGWRGRGDHGPLSAAVIERLSRDPRAAAMWEAAIRGGLGMPPLGRPDEGNRLVA